MFGDSMQTVSNERRLQTAGTEFHRSTPTDQYRGRFVELDTTTACWDTIHFNDPEPTSSGARHSISDRQHPLGSVRT